MGACGCQKSGHDTPEWGNPARPYDLNRRDALISLPDGHWGTLATIQAMTGLVEKDAQDEYTRRAVEEIIKSRNGDPVTALFLFARDNITYQDDFPAGVERIQDFRQLMASRAGDCDDKATWLATALTTIGKAVRFRIQSYASDFWANGWDHVYVEFYDWARWQWVALDPTADGHDKTPIAAPGWRQPLPLAGLDIWADYR